MENEKGEEEDQGREGRSRRISEGKIVKWKKTRASLTLRTCVSLVCLYGT